MRYLGHNNVSQAKEAEKTAKTSFRETSDKEKSADLAKGHYSTLIPYRLSLVVSGML